MRVMAEPPADSVQGRRDEGAWGEPYSNRVICKGRFPAKEGRLRPPGLFLSS